MPKNASFIRHTVVYGLGAVVLQALGFFFLPIHTRFLSANEFGLMQLVFRMGEVVNILLMFQGIGLATLNFYKLPDTSDGPKHIAASGTVFLLIASVVGLVLAVLAATPLMGYLGIPGSANYFIAGVLCFIAEASVILPLTLMQARLESFAFVVTNFAIATIRVVLTLVLVVGMGLGLKGVLLAFALSHLPFGIGLSIREMAKSSFIPKRSQLKDVAAYAFPFLPTGICFFVIRSGDQFLLTKNYGLEEVGCYAFGDQVARLVSMLVVLPIFKVWQTWRYEAFADERRAELFGVAITRIGIAYACVALGLFCFRDEGVTLLGSDAYDRAKIVLGPLVLAHFFMAAANFFDAPFHLLKRTDLKPWIAIASTIVIVCLYYALIPRYGISGAAYATVCGMFVHAMITYLVAQRIMVIELPWRRFTLLFVASLLCWWILVQLGNRGAWLGFRVIALLIWTVSCWFAGLITREEKQKLHDTVWRVARRLGMSGADQADES